jgi:uncharacterized membrane protein YidH (DUF202 family)
MTGPGQPGAAGRDPARRDQARRDPAGLADEPESPDVGLARQRTSMSWTRTAISFGATGAAILKNHVVAGVIVLGLGLVTLAAGRLLPAGNDQESRQRRLLLVTITVTAVGVVAIVVAFTARSPGFR